MAVLFRPLAVLLAALVLQTELFSELRMFDVMPELMLACTIAAAWTAGPDAGAAVGFTAGALYDLYLPSPLGLTALAYVIVGHMVGVVSAGSADTSERMIRRLVSVLGLLAGLMLFVVLGELFGVRDLYNGRLPKVLLVSTPYTMLLLPPVHRAMRWAFGVRPRTPTAPLRVSVVE